MRESSGRWDTDPFGILDPAAATAVNRDDDAKQKKQLSLSIEVALDGQGEWCRTGVPLANLCEITVAVAGNPSAQSACVDVESADLYEAVIKNSTKELLSADGATTGNAGKLSQECLSA